MNTWIPIKIDKFTDDLKRLNKLGWALLSFLMVESAHRDFCHVSLNLIANKLYIKDVRTVRKYLQSMIEDGFILCSHDPLNVNKNYLLEISLKYKIEALESKKYKKVKTNHFMDKLYHIKEHGWALYCLLTLYTNSNYGYAFPSYEKLQEDLSMSPNSIYKFSILLSEQNLLRFNEPDYITVINKDNKPITKKEIKKYYVL